MKGEPVPLLDLRAQYATLEPEIAAAMSRVVKAQHFVMGPEVEALEREIESYTGATHAIGCASGSDALLLALMSLGVGPGDQVIVPTYTFFATAGAVSRLGAEPIFADIDPATYNAAPESVEAAAAGCSRLRAIIPVQLYGQCADLAALRQIAEQHGVALVQDSAQAIGGRDADGAAVGSWPELNCFSFFPSKNLGAYGDGGLVTTGDSEQAALLRALRTHGTSKKKYYHDRVGMNSRLDALQAAVLRVKLPHLEAWVVARGEAARRYDAMFAEAGAADSRTPLSAGGLPLRFPAVAAAPARHAYHQYVIRVPAERRDPLIEHLKARGIGSAIYYPLPLHRQECFRDGRLPAGALPQAEAAARETLALPIYPELSETQGQTVAGSVIEFIRA